jgi:outer membrane lipoprotein-sorting protein
MNTWIFKGKAMNKKSVFAFVLASFLISTAAFAQNLNKVGEVLTKIDEAGKNIETLEVNFRQTMTFTETMESQVSAGTMFFMRPMDVLIHKKTPQEQKIYIKGDLMTIYTPKNAQAIISPANKTGIDDFSPVSFINFGGNWKNLQKNNVINYISESETDYVLEIYPKKSRTWTMVVFIAKEGLNPSKITLNSDTLSIEVILLNYKTDQKMDKNTFIFNAPSGVEVIKLK